MQRIDKAAQYENRILRKVLGNNIVEIDVKKNDEYRLFLSKIEDYFLHNNMMSLRVAKRAKDSYTLTNFQQIGNKSIIKKSKGFQIYDPQICKVIFIPHENGVELFDLEVYNIGKGIGTLLMNVFTQISKETGVKIFLIPGAPQNNKNANIKKNRDFYHKFGFSRSKTSAYWTNVV